jgi:Protein of unknown function (DUF3105)
MHARALPLAAAALLVIGLLPASAQDGPGRKLPDRGQEHIPQGTKITYQEYPPSSGKHWPVWAPWAIYKEAVPEEVFVHNLEHGGIVVLYNCATPCPDLVRQLEESFAALPKSKFGHVKVVISPNPRVKGRLALLAWTRIDDLDRFDRDRIVRFVQAWQDKGPEDVP